MVKKLSKELQQHVYNGGFLHCKDIHDHTCIWNAVLKFQHILNMAYKFYTPLHALPVLLFKRTKLIKE